MARIAIVHFTDDHTADEWTDDGEVEAYGGRVVGLFDYPARKNCVDHPNCFINGKQAWTRDRMGFMKCGVCGKRNKQVRRFLINALFDFLGANLYPSAPGAFRTPDGYGPRDEQNPR